MNVRIFWVRAMKCMCAQTRPRFILSSEGVLRGMEFEPMLTPREKSPLPENVPRGGSNPRHCGQRAQALPTELFRPLTCCLILSVPGYIVNKVIALAGECVDSVVIIRKFLLENHKRYSKKCNMVFKGNWMKILNLVLFCFHFHYWKIFRQLNGDFFKFFFKQKKFLSIITVWYLTRTWSKKKKKKSWKWKLCWSLYILRVPDQNSVSWLYNMLEVHHSGREPLICKNRNKTVYECIMTLTSHANRKVGSTAMPTYLTSTPTSPLLLCLTPWARSPPVPHWSPLFQSLTDFKVCARSLSTSIRVPLCWGSLTQQLTNIVGSFLVIPSLTIMFQWIIR